MKMNTDAWNIDYCSWWVLGEDTMMMMKSLAMNFSFHDTDGKYLSIIH